MLFCDTGKMDLQNNLNNNNPFPTISSYDHRLLNCGICHSSYNNPKVLPCLHSFCEQCLFDYIPAESLSVTCPVCRQQSILPIDGVRALQANIFITSLMDVTVHGLCGVCHLEFPRLSTKCSTCVKNLCDTCAQLHRQDENLNTHDLVPIPECLTSDGHSNLVCPNHGRNDLQFYCTSCETGVCKDCTTVEHIGHDIISLPEAVEEHRTTLEALIKEARDQIPKLDEARNSISDVDQSLTNQTKITECKIAETFDNLIRLMSNRKETLIKDLYEVYNEKHLVLMNQKDNLANQIERIKECCEVTEETLTDGSDSDILLVRKEMSQKLQEFAAGVIRKEPEENEFIDFDTAHCQGLMKSLGTLGYIKTNSAIAFNTTATGEGLKHAYVNKPGVIMISTKDCHGNLVKVGNAVIDSELQASNGDRIIPAITDQQNGMYELVYLLPREDNYVMFIKLFGRHIKGSPYKIKAVNVVVDDHGDTPGAHSKIPRTAAIKQKGTKRPSSSKSGSHRKSNLIEDDLLWRVGVKGRNKGEFTNPQGVCCIDNRILVADSNNQVAQVFTLTGECKLKFGLPGRIPGKMQRPTGVAVTQNGNFLIADYDNKWISVFAPDGKYVNKIGTGKLLGPKGLAVDRNGHIIVVDNKASTIFIFQSNGKLLSKFGSRGNGDQQFAGPHYVAVNANNDIIVTDFHNHCVKVFDCEGNFLFRFGSNGEGNGQFNAPTGIAVDEFGNMLVADWGNSRIQVFDSNGSFLSYVNTTADPLYGPQGLAITPENTVVVSDSGNHCIKVYKYLQ